MTVIESLNERTMLQILQVRQVQTHDVSSRRLASSIPLYGIPSQDNETSPGESGGSKSDQNVAATVIVASILPALLAIFLLVMIVG